MTFVYKVLECGLTAQLLSTATVMMLKASLLIASTCLLLVVPILEARNVVVQKTVSVKSPTRQTSVINHFNPAGHVYAATGGVIIDEGEVEEKKAPLQSNFNSVNYNNALNLQKTVSVKSPTRDTSVINHFNPAGHNYDALGNVVINRGTSPSKSFVQPAISKITTTYVRQPSTFVSTKSTSQGSGINSGSPSKFHLERTVSVKSPEHKSSVINHFSPAQHVYAATGNVVINKDSSTENRVQQALPSRTETVRTQVRTEPAVQYVQPQLNLEKTVSVKSPVRDTSVINHFNPAGHKYDAHGNVVINRGASASTSFVQKTQQVQPSISKVTTFQQQPSSFVATKSTSQGSGFGSGSSSKFNLERTVSVKSPDHKSSVISHFSPAQHVYAATGNVVINRDSSTENRVQQALPSRTETVRTQVRTEPAQVTKITKVRTEPVVQYVQPLINLEKTVSVKSPTRDTSVINHFNPAGHKYDAEGNVVINRGASASTSFVQKIQQVQPSISKVTTFQQQPSSFVATKSTGQGSGFGSGSFSKFNLERTVSVKSPDHKSSVISHFSPAQHVYAATGNVVINRDSSTENRVQQALPSRTETVRTQVRTQPAQVTKITKVRTEPVVQYVQPQINLEKTVSVKSPTRDTSVINHFNPAGHKYDAEGNVVINRGASASTSFVQKTQQVQPSISKVTTFQQQPSSFVATKSTSQGSGFGSGSSSKFNLERTVSVKSPDHKSSVISHFSPAQHVYAATGNVVINKDSSTENRAQLTLPSRTETVRTQVRTEPAQVTKITKVRTEPVVQYVIPQLNLEKTVSVKSPTRDTSVINHFNPAGHKYDAEGNVVINRGASASTSIVQKTQQVQPVVSKITTFQQQPSTFVATKSTSQGSGFGSGSSSKFNLERTVSVKSPDHKSSVISHFSPAQHVYAATGNVVINRDSSTENRVQQALPSRTETVRTQVRTEPAKVTKITKVRTEPVVQYVQPLINLEKTVSVKSPTRDTSVINHFNPAGHKYDAEGNVVINRGASASTSFVQKTQQVQPSISKVTTFQQQPSTFVATKSTSQGSGFGSGSSSKFNLERTVSVKSPDHKSSVISHFSPAQHVYAATGNVVINRDSSTENRVQQALPSRTETVRTQVRTQPAQVTKITKVRTEPVVQYVQPQLNLEKTVSVKSPTRDTSVINHFNPAGHKYDAEGNVVINRGASASTSFVQKTQVQPTISKVTTFQQQPSTFVATKSTSQGSGISSGSSSKFNLERTVSVKSPDHKSSVISHFSPAQHVYAATGNVVINRDSSTDNRAQLSLPSRTETVRTQVRTEPAQVTKITKVRTEPAVQYVQPQLNLEKTVSVKSPTRDTSVISHFNPAGHKYDAEGNVVINRGASASTSFVQKTQVQPTISKVTTFQQQPSTFVSTKATSQGSGFGSGSSSNFNLERTVSVKSPDHKSSVISHFSPAQHVYAATGNVVIHKESSQVNRVQLPVPSRTETVKTQVKTEPVQVTKVSKVVNKPEVQAPSSSELDVKKSESAEEEKVINRDDESDDSSEESLDISNFGYLPPSKPFVRAPSSQINTPQKPIAAASVPVINRAPSGLSLQREVSVAVPPHRISPVDHFNPASHQYAASGSVSIKQ